MTTPENKLGKHNDDTNKPKLPGESKGTERSYDQMVEAAKLDAKNSPQHKVTSDNANSLVNNFVRRFNSIMEYAKRYNLSLKDAAERLDQENSDRLLAMQLQSQEVTKRLRTDTTTTGKEPTTEKSSDQQAPRYTVVAREKLSDLVARARVRKAEFKKDPRMQELLRYTRETPVWVYNPSEEEITSWTRSFPDADRDAIRNWLIMNHEDKVMREHIESMQQYEDPSRQPQQEQGYNQSDSTSTYDTGNPETSSREALRAQTRALYNSDQLEYIGDHEVWTGARINASSSKFDELVKKEVYRHLPEDNQEYYMRQIEYYDALEADYVNGHKQLSDLSGAAAGLTDLYKKMSEYVEFEQNVYDLTGMISERFSGEQISDEDGINIKQNVTRAANEKEFGWEIATEVIERVNAPNCRYIVHAIGKLDSIPQPVFSKLNEIAMNEQTHSEIREHINEHILGPADERRRSDYLMYGQFGAFG